MNFGLSDIAALGVKSNSLYTGISTYTAAGTLTLSQRRQTVSELIEFLRIRHRYQQTPGCSWRDLSVEANIELERFEALKLKEDIARQQKVIIIGDDIFYRPTYPELTSTAAVLQKIAEFPLGMEEPPLLDSHLNMKNMLEQLQQNGSIFKIEGSDRQNARYYLRDIPELRIDNRIKELWNDVKVPQDSVQLDELLLKSGHLDKNDLITKRIERLKRDNAQRLRRKQLEQDRIRLEKSAARALKKKQVHFRTRITNTHLIGKVDWLSKLKKSH